MAFDPVKRVTGAWSNRLWLKVIRNLHFYIMIHPKEDAKKTLEYCKRFKQLRLATQHQRQKQSAVMKLLIKDCAGSWKVKHGQKLGINDGTESEKE